MECPKRRRILQAGLALFSQTWLMEHFVRQSLRDYGLSLAAGIAVGIFYALIAVEAPAPPIAALLGLLGMLIGEQLIPVGRRLLAGSSFAGACEAAGATFHLFGHLPGRHARPAPARPLDADA